jgi:hypothetical protein
MPKYDVIVIGGGPGGLCNAAILAKNNKKVLLLEKDSQVGGVSIGIPYKGHILNLGWNQIEDTGSGLTRVFEYVGKELRHSQISQSMPLYIDGNWVPTQELLAAERSKFKKFIKMVTQEISWEDIDKLDDQIVRPWVRKHDLGEGVLTLLELMAIYEGVTFDWWDHSLSEQLWLRKLHFTERQMAGYCFSPADGWEKIWNFLADAIKENGGEIRVDSRVTDIVIENGRTMGVEVLTRKPFMATDYPESEMIEASCVVSTLPCWNVLDIVDVSLIPGWYADQIRFQARDDMRGGWVGIYAALPEPLSVAYPREMPGWFQGPITGKIGIATDFTSFDPNISPPGEHLVTVMAVVEYHKFKSKKEVNQFFSDFEKEAEILLPVLKKRLWTERHVVFDPAYDTLWKPGTVGLYKPDVEVPAVEGLYFAGETFRGRSVGTDRAARIAMTVTEKILGRAIPEFKDSWHY